MTDDQQPNEKPPPIAPDHWDCAKCGAKTPHRTVERREKDQPTVREMVCLQCGTIIPAPE